MKRNKTISALLIIGITLTAFSFIGGNMLLGIALTPKGTERSLSANKAVIAKRYPYVMHIGYMYHHDLNYNIFLPDLQYHGASEGASIQMGWNDRLDIKEWLSVANDLWKSSCKRSVTKMVVHGISMGAATTMMLSGESLPAYVRCFVEDCGYTSVWDQFKKELKEDYGLPPFPILYCADYLCQWRYHWSFEEASALRQVSKCKRPMLFIHGGKDKYVPTWMVHKLYAAKPQPKSLYIVPEAIHAYSYKEHPHAYTRIVRQFLNCYN